MTLQIKVRVFGVRLLLLMYLHKQTIVNVVHVQGLQTASFLNSSHDVEIHLNYHKNLLCPTERDDNSQMMGKLPPA